MYTTFQSLSCPLPPRSADEGTLSWVLASPLTFGVGALVWAPRPAVPRGLSFSAVEAELLAAPLVGETWDRGCTLAVGN